MVKYVVRDSSGNVVDTRDEPLASDVPQVSVPMSTPQISSEPEPAPKVSYKEGEYAYPEGLGAEPIMDRHPTTAGFMSGLEEVNEFNPFYSDWFGLPVAAGVASTITGEKYKDVLGKMKERKEARRRFGRATEDKPFEFVRETTQKLGKQLEPIEDILMGQAALKWAANTARGAAALSKLASLPGAETVAKVGGAVAKPFVTQNPWVRGGSWSGLVGGGTLISDLRSGKNLPQAAAHALINAAGTFGATTGLATLPAWAAYPAGMAGTAAMNYAGRKFSGKPTELSDVVADTLTGVPITGLYRTIIPTNKFAKGSKDVKAVDRYKKIDPVDTENLVNEIENLGYPANTKAITVPLDKNVTVMREVRKASPKAASAVVKKHVRPALLEEGEKLNKTISEKYPGIRSTKEAQEAQAVKLREGAKSFDESAKLRLKDTSIPASDVNNVAKPGTTENQLINDAYYKVGGRRNPDMSYNGYYLDLAREQLAKEGATDVVKMGVADSLKQKISSETKAVYNKWKPVDTASHENILLEEAMGRSSTPESIAADAKRTVWQNTHVTPKSGAPKYSRNVPPKDLEKISVPNPKDATYPAGTEQSIKRYNYLVDMEKAGNAKLTSAGDNLPARAAAAQLGGGSLARYNVLTKLFEWLGGLHGKYATRGIANLLANTSIGDFEKMLQAVWETGVPTANILDIVKKLPKRKEANK